jgi:hypothetical protein
MGQAQQLWLLSSFCALNRKSFDPAVFAQHFPPPGSMATFGAACAALGLRLDSVRRVRVLRGLPSVAGGWATRTALVLFADERK